MKKITIILILVLLFSYGRSEKLFFRMENGGNYDVSVFGDIFTIFCYIDSTDCNT